MECDGVRLCTDVPNAGCKTKHGCGKKSTQTLLVTCKGTIFPDSTTHTHTQYLLVLIKGSPSISGYRLVVYSWAWRQLSGPWALSLYDIAQIHCSRRRRFYQGNDLFIYITNSPFRGDLCACCIHMTFRGFMPLLQETKAPDTPHVSIYRILSCHWGLLGQASVASIDRSHCKHLNSRERPWSNCKRCHTCWK